VYTLAKLWQAQTLYILLNTIPPCLPQTTRLCHSINLHCHNVWPSEIILVFNMSEPCNQHFLIMKPTGSSQGGIFRGRGTCPGHWFSRYGTKWPIVCWCATATWSRPPHWLPTNTTLVPIPPSLISAFHFCLFSCSFCNITYKYLMFWYTHFANSHLHFSYGPLITIFLNR